MGKVLYILSVGHSGSTLLDYTFGQFDNVFSTGELKHLTWQLYREINGIENSQGKCTCGKTFRNCNVWSEILDNIAIYKSLNINSIPSNFDIKHFDKLSFYEDKPFLKGIRKFYKDSLKYRYFTRMIGKFAETVNNNNKLLYDNIFKVTNSNYIVDSSKDIIRFNELRKKNDIFPIILIRSVGNLVKSKHVKGDLQKVKNNWTNYYNNYCKNIIKDMKPTDYHIISFEKFLENPRKEIEKFALKININTDNFKTSFLSKNYHLVAGNPMRYNETIKIQEKNMDYNNHIMKLEKSGLANIFLKSL